MASRANVVRATAVPFKAQTQKSDQRLKEGFAKFKKALEQDAREAAARGSGLPKDWRNRILK